MSLPGKCFLLCRQYIVEKLEVGKWIFLWVVLGEAISLGLALVMRLMGNLEGKYDNMELEEANRLHDMELQGISKSMTAQQKITNKNEDRLSCCHLSQKSYKIEDRSRANLSTKDYSRSKALLFTVTPTTSRSVFSLEDSVKSCGSV